MLKRAMITRTEKIRQTPVWQQALAQSIQSLDELLDYVNLSRDQVAVSKSACEQFSLKIPRGYADRMQPGNSNDPLLKQVLPTTDEDIQVANYIKDPVGDQDAIVADGVLQKYHGRVLLLTTGACAVHCRYCFRRHFPYAEANAARNDWSSAIHYLQSNKDVHEVILSGGDPLTLTDERLSHLVEKLDKLPHINTLRIHTRLPVVLPERICDDLLSWLKHSRLDKVIVIHSNHSREIDHTVIDGLARLKQAGATLLNQAVLLKGINDSSDELIALSHGLFKAGVLPYYLHLLDPVAGASHFNVNTEKACALIREIQSQLPGYLVPRLVREMAGETSKTPVSSWKIPE
jgi:EF-P beta-lysylation protein EpmB